LEYGIHRLRIGSGSVAWMEAGSFPGSAAYPVQHTPKAMRCPCKSAPSFTPSWKTAAAGHQSQGIPHRRAHPPPGMLAKEAIVLTPANWLKARSGKPVRMVA
jgi:hypothetical protein